LDVDHHCANLPGQHSSGNQKAEEEAKKDADKQIKDIQAAAKKGEDKVIKDLLNAVSEAKPEVPNRIEVPQ
jgi:V-type H+-transporting ATPase subunit G